MKSIPSSRSPWRSIPVWLSSTGLTVSLLLLAGLLGLILIEGLRAFWPRAVVELYLQTDDGDVPVAGFVLEEPNGEQGTWQIEVVNRAPFEPRRRIIPADAVRQHSYDRESTALLHRSEGWLYGIEAEVGDAPTSLLFRDRSGGSLMIDSADVIESYAPNGASIRGRAALFLGRIQRFLSSQPENANTAGGIFPAIVGTFWLTVLMSVAVMPLGVLAALYLHEYARSGVWVSIVRIGVNNLAGVPSIVFGVFGLGFFIYVLGDGVDHLFYSESGRTVFGTGGIFWASLTLAILTLPVVVVATEESLDAVPQGWREASLAAGASKWQTIFHIVLPSSLPGILTGLILAVARGAGEVAPLMLVGVVKLAPSLPVDGSFPFVHLERKFMHLGFHIYDLGFQSPNADAAQPLVFATTLVLVLIVLSLNFCALLLRNRLRANLQQEVF